MQNQLLALKPKQLGQQLLHAKNRAVNIVDAIAARTLEVMVPGKPCQLVPNHTPRKRDKGQLAPVDKLPEVPIHRGNSKTWNDATAELEDLAHGKRPSHFFECGQNRQPLRRWSAVVARERGCRYHALLQMVCRETMITIVYYH